MAVRFNETERRRKFAKKITIRTLFWLGLFGACLAGPLVLLEQTQCRADQAIEWGRVCLKCRLEHCASCKEGGIESCDACKEGFYQEVPGGECLDATCQIKRCERCDESGPQGCDQCEEGFFLNRLINTCQSTTCLIPNCVSCRQSGESLCDQCDDGFVFNRESLMCEDTRCKVTLCDECAESGIYGCDKCLDGFYFDMETGKCEDATCQIQFCDKCDAHPGVCEQCAVGFWHDQENNACVDETCLVPHCGECSSKGPSVCDACEPGHFLKSPTECGDCDIYPYSVQCLECSSEERCDVCNVGFRLDQATGRCEGCQKDKCAHCDDFSGECKECRDGFFLNGEGECEPCSGDCRKCRDAATCDECDPTIHYSLTPLDGVCECDPFRYYVSHPSGEPFKCQCTEKYRGVDNRCYSCSGMIFGCFKCELVTENAHKSLGFETKANELYPDVVPGVYECKECGGSGNYLDKFAQMCRPCSEKFEGCTRCSFDGESCEECQHGYYLSDGSCFNCRFHDSRCDRCSTTACYDCEPGWSGVYVGNWFSCVKSFF